MRVCGGGGEGGKGGIAGHIPLIKKLLKLELHFYLYINIYPCQSNSDL